MKTTQPLNMDTKITDLSMLGMALISGMTGAIDNYGSFLFTSAITLFFAMIRWRNHKQTMRNLKLDEQLKKKQLDLK